MVSLILALLGFLIYSNTLPGAFYFDDHRAILENFAIRQFDLRFLWIAFNTRFVAGLTFALNYALGKLNPFGYHLFNISLHAISSFLVYQLVLVTSRTPSLQDSAEVKNSRKIALFASLLFLVHPIQTQAVNYVWQRTVLLAAFFYLASVLLYACARLYQDRLAYAGAWVSCLLGLFSKEIAVTIPVTLFLYEFFFFGSPKENFSKRILSLVPFFLLLPVIPLALTQAHHVRMGLVANTPTLEGNSLINFFLQMSRWSSNAIPRETYFFTQLNVFRTYLRLLVFPVRQNLDYDYPLARTLAEPGTFFSGLFLLTLLLIACKLFRHHRLLAFGIFWFFITLSVESFFILEDLLFEHRLYLPTVGFALFLSSCLFRLLKSGRASTVFLLAVLFVFSVAAYRRNGVWADEVTLWEDTLRKSPNKARPYNNLGMAHGKRGDYDKEISYCLEAVAKDPDFFYAYNNLGVAYGQKGETEKEIEYYEKAIAINPRLVTTHVNLGAAYGKKGELEKALAILDRAIQMDPYHPGAYSNLGVIYGKSQNIVKEIESYLKAIHLDPDNVYAYSNLAIALAEAGEIAEGIIYCHKAISLNPEFAQAHFNLGFLYLQQGDLTLYHEQVERLRSLGNEEMARRLEEIYQGGTEEPSS